MSGPSGDRGPTEPGYINGGMLAREESARIRSGRRHDVPSIDTALADRRAARRQHRRPEAPVGAMGFTAYVKDPEGNVIGLWETAASS